MGNRALRKQLGNLVGTFYKGSKGVAYRYYNAKRLKGLIEQANLKVGDVIHDCSGWNHRIAKIEPMWTKTGGGKALCLRQFEITFEDGNFRCECSQFIEPAHTVEQIQSFWKTWIEYQKKNSEWAEGKYYDVILQRLETNLPICDEWGIELPEIRSLGGSNI